jgi:hypothetical protein
MDNVDGSLMGALPIDNLAQLGSTLDHLRKPARKARG